MSTRCRSRRGTRPTYVCMFVASPYKHSKKLVSYLCRAGKGTTVVGLRAWSHRAFGASFLFLRVLVSTFGLLLLDRWVSRFVVLHAVFPRDDLVCNICWWGGGETCRPRKANFCFPLKSSRNAVYQEKCLASGCTCSSWSSACQLGRGLGVLGLSALGPLCGIL